MKINCCLQLSHLVQNYFHHLCSCDRLRNLRHPLWDFQCLQVAWYNKPLTVFPLRRNIQQASNKLKVILKVNYLNILLIMCTNCLIQSNRKISKLNCILNVWKS